MCSCFVLKQIITDQSPLYEPNRSIVYVHVGIRLSKEDLVVFHSVAFQPVQGYLPYVLYHPTEICLTSRHIPCAVDDYVMSGSAQLFETFYSARNRFHFCIRLARLLELGDNTIKVNGYAHPTPRLTATAQPGTSSAGARDDPGEGATLK